MRHDRFDLPSHVTPADVEAALDELLEEAGGEPVTLYELTDRLRCPRDPARLVVKRLGREDDLKRPVDVMAEIARGV